MRISGETTIDRPAADVFRFIAEDHHANHPKWDPSVVSIRPLAATAPGAGTGFAMTRKLLGRTETLTFKFVVWEPESKMSYEAQGGPLAIRFDSTLEPLGPARTRLTVTGTARPAGPRALLAPVIRPLFARHLQHNLARIKGLVESAD